jgi:hypothetical protein
MLDEPAEGVVTPPGRLTSSASSGTSLCGAPGRRFDPAPLSGFSSFAHLLDHQRNAMDALHAVADEAGDRTAPRSSISSS